MFLHKMKNILHVQYLNKQSTRYEQLQVQYMYL